MDIQAERWRFRDTSGYGNTTVAEGKTFKKAMLDAMRKVDHPETAFDLQIQVRISKNRGSFWKTVHGREFRMMVEDYGGD